MEKSKEQISLKIGKYDQKDTPLVSVAIIAYNVGKFLEEAIESVLLQKTSFKVELVIGEDCSTDNTREIALAYQAKYPEVIRVLLHEKNLGLTPNSVATQNACRGKYIALLDGDDYWTDEWKLHKQVRELERNPSYSACAHQALIIKGNAENPVRNFGEEIDQEYSILDTISHRKFHTSALLYRREYWVKTGGIPENISSNERAIYPMLAIFGKIKYLRDNMCVYRLAPTGLNSRITSKELETDLNMLPWLKGIEKKFPVWRFRSFLHLCAFTYPAKMNSWALFKHWFQFSLYSFSYFPNNFGDFKHGLVKLFEIFRRDFLWRKN